MKSYSELLSLPTFEDRFEYLKLNGSVGEDTFGSLRFLNQQFYTSKVYRDFRREMVVRDNGCELACPDRPIRGFVVLHHINPLSPEDIENYTEKLMDPENVICVSDVMHKAIHYGDLSLLPAPYVDRRPGDTILWESIKRR